MSNPTYYTVRLEPTMKDYIKEVYEHHDGYKSIKHFAERAVSNNAKYIEQEVKGAADLRRLIQALCRVDGISVELPERTINTKLVGENLSSATKIQMDSKQLNSVSEITRSTEMSKGDVIRSCIIRELFKLSSMEDLLHEPRKSDIENSWLSIEDNIEILFSTLLSQLETKVVTQWTSTQQKIDKDPRGKDSLIAHYENYFKETPGHQRLQKSEQGQEILSKLEMLSHGG